MYQKLIKSAAVLGADAVILTGEGSNGEVVIPGAAYTTATATATGNTAYGSGITTYAPTMAGDLPTNKGLAIKFTQPSH